MIGSSSTDLPFVQRFAECGPRCDFEGQRRGVDVAVLAVDQLHLDVNDREACDDAGGKNALETLFDAGDVFLRHRAADDLGFELVAFTGLVGLDHDRHRSELAGTAGLLFVGVTVLHPLGDALKKRHLRCANSGVQLVSSAQDVDF